MPKYLRWYWCLPAAIVLAAMTTSAQQQQQPVVDPVEGIAATGEASGDALGLGEGIDVNLVRRGGDFFKSPQTAEQFELRQQALEQRLAGKGSGRIHEIAKGQYVELQQERADKIFVVLVEYGDQNATGLPPLSGPRYNQIPEPNRALDNNTIWQPDYTRPHYENMYFNKMNAFYGVQSSGRYSINGRVTDWVRVPFNGLRYGTNSLGDAATWTLIADAINMWTQDQLAAGKSMEDIKAYLSEFDTWDRYDYDKDGDFNEPDGYIDHFQIVHAGAGEETGGGTLGSAAIWSHRWFAFYNRRGSAGPAYNKYGGLEFGGGWGANPSGTTSGSSSASVGATRANVTNAYPANPTGFWVGDYTIQPENGGLGVFAHEFGHDLGLPDHYDTAGGDNGIGFWNIMAVGSYLGDGTIDIGSDPGHMTAWDKFQLGWLNYEVASAGTFSSHRVGPAETNTKQAQGVIVVLPPDTNTTFVYNPSAGPLPSGTKAFWSRTGDLVDNNMTAPVSVPSGASVYLYMWMTYQIEANWDYAYVSVSTDGGTTWTNLPGQYRSATTPTETWSALTTTTNPNGPNLGNGITGLISAWRYARFDVSSYAGQQLLLRVRYRTDDYTNYKGLVVDDITLGSFSDDAESGGAAWTMSGFKVTTGAEVSMKPHYYIAEFRQYRDHDKGLQTGPYSFGDAARPNWVYHYPYQDGLLITYWDLDQPNDNASQHPGEGRSLPVDAHPDPFVRTGTIPVSGGPAFSSVWSARLQSSDATFGLEPTDALHIPFVVSYLGTRYQFFFDSESLPAVSEFDDANSYWNVVAPQNSVIVPHTGTKIRVINTSAQDNFMQIHVVPAK